MEGLINTLKSTFSAPAADTNNPTEPADSTTSTTTGTTHDGTTAPTSPGRLFHTGDAHTPSAPTLPGSFENDSSTPNTQPQEPRLPEMKTAGLGSALPSHLTHTVRADTDNASTTAVQDEPDSTSPEAKSAFTEQMGAGKSDTGLENKLSDLGLGENKSGTTGFGSGDASSRTGEDFEKESSHPAFVQSKLNRDLARHTPSSDEPELSSREGQVGAFNSEGTKVHDSNESAPKALGVMGGSHLNSSDNRGPSSGEQNVFSSDNQAPSFGAQEPNVSSLPGKVGAFDSEGTKVHDSTDSTPKALGVMGGSHLNSSDNRGPGSGEQSVFSSDNRAPSFGKHDSTDSAPKALGATGGSQFNSSDNRGPSASEQDPTVSSLPGKVGAYNAEGTKVHDATDSSPKPFGVMGGSHLNSPDNKPETAGQPLRDDQGEGLLGPGPAMMALPPTEPTSTTDLNAPSPKRSSSSSPVADESTSSNTATKSLSPPAEEPLAPTTTGRSLTPSGTRKDEDSTTMGLDKKASEGGLSDHSGTSAGGSPKKVGLGDKVKGLVTEIKGKAKKDPAMVEEGKAIRHGEAHSTSTV